MTFDHLPPIPKVTIVVLKMSRGSRITVKRKMSSFVRHSVILGACTVMFFVLSQCALLKPQSQHAHLPLAKEKETRQIDESIQSDSKDIFYNNDALFSYVKKFGLRQTITHLYELTPLYGDCHQSAHKAGRFAYEIFSTESFRSWGPECHWGGPHGTIEAYFREHGTSNIAGDVKLICGPELNPFLMHQCLHGIGHGLMAWSNYEIPIALSSCDLLNEGMRSCWSGVFMENIVGSLVHAGNSEHYSGRPTKYLSDDPHYPCTIVDEKYKWECYFLQTDRMLQLFGGDFSKVVDACFEAPRRYQPACFESMGRDVSGRYRDNPAGAIEACAKAPQGQPRTRCIKGAVQDTFWDPAGQDMALNFCKAVRNKTEKDQCYTTVFSRALELLTSKESLKKFCGKAESYYRATCLNLVQR
jgi:hypothetical protein